MSLIKKYYIGSIYVKSFRDSSPLILSFFLLFLCWLPICLMGTSDQRPRWPRSVSHFLCNCSSSPKSISKPGRASPAALGTRFGQLQPPRPCWGVGKLKILELKRRFSVFRCALGLQVRNFIRTEKIWSIKIPAPAELHNAIALSEWELRTHNFMLKSFTAHLWWPNFHIP